MCIIKKKSMLILYLKIILKKFFSFLQVIEKEIISLKWSLNWMIMPHCKMDKYIKLV